MYGHIGSGFEWQAVYVLVPEDSLRGVRASITVSNASLSCNAFAGSGDQEVLIGSVSHSHRSKRERKER